MTAVFPSSSSTSRVAAAVNVADLVASHAVRRPDAIALVADDQRLSWARLDARATAAASDLAARGLLGGQRVALLGVNSAAWVIAWFGALRAGYVVVPINPQSTADEVSRIVAHSGAVVLLADRVDDDRAAGLDIAVVALGTDWQPHGEVSSPRDPDALAVLLYTAGTSGEPKAAMLSHHALLAHCANAHAVDQLHPDDVIACVLPLFHVFGLNAVLDMVAYLGARLVLLDGLPDDLAELADLIEAEHVTVLPLAPVALHRLLALPGVERLSKLRLVLSGAAPLSGETRAAFTERTGVPVDQGYGLTEAAPGVATTLGGERHGLGHVGRPFPGVDVRIGDGSDDADPDRVYVRGANVFSGYWPDGAGGPDASGWFDTGDIGYLDDGELFLVDRSRELIIVNGFNVYPAEVEDVISEVDGVDAVAVVRQIDDRDANEHVVAFVVGRATEEQVQAHCSTRLARFKRPTTINVVADLPRGATGKIRKGALRSQLSVLGAEPDGA